MQVKTVLLCSGPANSSRVKVSADATKKSFPILGPYPLSKVTYEFSGEYSAGGVELWKPKEKERST